MTASVRVQCLYNRQTDRWEFTISCLSHTQRRYMRNSAEKVVYWRQNTNRRSTKSYSGRSKDAQRCIRETWERRTNFVLEFYVKFILFCVTNGGLQWKLQISGVVWLFCCRWVSHNGIPKSFCKDACCRSEMQCLKVNAREKERERRDVTAPSP